MLATSWRSGKKGIAGRKTGMTRTKPNQGFSLGTQSYQLPPNPTGQKNRFLAERMQYYSCRYSIVCYTILGFLMTWFIPRCHLRSHYPVCIENNLFIVGIRPIINRETEFIYQSDRSDRTYVYSQVSVIRQILDIKTQHKFYCFWI